MDSRNINANEPIVINPNYQSDPRNVSVDPQQPSPLTQMRIADQKPKSNQDDLQLSKGIPINTNVPDKKETYNTLDESVCDTLKRDISRISHKLQHVLIPTLVESKSKEIQNWDLWGPLIICLSLCLVLSLRDLDTTTTSTFTIIFGFVFFGGVAISVNSQFLGVQMGICSAACLLGYCIFPFLVAAIVNCFIPDNFLSFIKLISTGVAIIWACISSLGFVSSIAPHEKKFVILYPFVLFYVSLGLFTL